MHYLKTPTALFAVTICCFEFMIASTLFAQGSLRNANDTKRSSKFLTPGEVDRWVFDGTKHEVIYVDVSSGQFDPVLELASIEESSKSNLPKEEIKAKEEAGDFDTIMVSDDGAGNASHFRFRLPKTGKYAIRVHGFEMKGGGHYDLGIRRFRCSPIEPGKRIEGRFDHEGQACFFFSGKLDENLAFQLRGQSRVSIVNERGAPVMFNWRNNFNVPADGEYILVLNGSSNYRFGVTMHEAIVRTMELGANDKARVQPHTLNVWDIQGNPGQFRHIQITRSPDMHVRLVYAPDKKVKRELSRHEQTFREIQLLPVSSKGEVTQYVAVLGRAGRYQIQAYPTESIDVEVSMLDPTTPVARNTKTNHKVPIGGTRFYGFEAKAGDLIDAKLLSSSFDGWLRLYDERGQLVFENDDTEGSRNSQITHMVTRNGYYRWQVSSLGNGGGGDYRLDFTEIALKKTQIGQVKSGTLKNRTTDYWELQGKKGQEIFINTRSRRFVPIVSIYGPNGKQHHRDSRSGVGDNGLIAIRLPQSGRYTIWISSNTGGGEYDLRLLNASWTTPTSSK